MLRSKYACGYAHGLCKLNKCDRYILCTREVKKNFKAWTNAYEKNNREELDRLMRGGVWDEHGNSRGTGYQ